MLGCASPAHRYGHDRRVQLTVQRSTFGDCTSTALSYALPPSRMPVGFCRLRAAGHPRRCPCAHEPTIFGILPEVVCMLAAALLSVARALPFLRPTAVCRPAAGPARTRPPTLRTRLGSCAHHWPVQHSRNGSVRVDWRSSDTTTEQVLSSASRGKGQLVR